MTSDGIIRALWIAGVLALLGISGYFIYARRVTGAPLHGEGVSFVDENDEVPSEWLKKEKAIIE